MGNKIVLRSTSGAVAVSAAISTGAQGADGPSSGGAVSSVNGQTGAVTLTAASITETSTKKILTDTERAKLSGIATGATANQTDAYLLDLSNATGVLGDTHLPDPTFADLPIGVALRVYSQVSTGFWPTSFASDGTPSYTGGSQTTGLRPTSRNLSIDWVQVVSGGSFPPPVASGTAGMRQGLDFRFKVQSA